MFVVAVLYVLISSVVAFYLLNGGFGVANRRQMWVVALIHVVLIVAWASLSGVLNANDLWLLLLILAASQAIFFGFRSQFRYFDVADDPRARDEAGYPQLGGRSRQYWSFWLNLSPWHVQRYRNLLEVDMARRAQDEEDPEVTGL